MRPRWQALISEVEVRVELVSRDRVRRVDLSQGRD